LRFFSGEDGEPKTVLESFRVGVPGEGLESPMFFHLNKHSVGLLKRLHLQWHRDAQRCTESLKVTPFQLFQLFQLFYQLSQTLSILMAMDGLGRGIPEAADPEAPKERNL